MISIWLSVSHHLKEYGDLRTIMIPSYRMVTSLPPVVELLE